MPEVTTGPESDGSRSVRTPQAVIKEQSTQTRINPNIIFQPENLVPGSDVVAIPHGWITKPENHRYLQPFLESANFNGTFACTLGARELKDMSGLTALTLKIYSKSEFDSMTGPSIALGAQTPATTRGSETDVSAAVAKIPGVKSVTPISVDGQAAGLGFTTFESRNVVQLTYGPTEIRASYNGDIGAPGNGVAQFEKVLAAIQTLAPADAATLPPGEATPNDQQYATQLGKTIVRLKESIALGQKINSSPEKWAVLSKAVDIKKALAEPQAELAQDLADQLKPLETKWQTLQAQADQLRAEADQTDANQSILDRIPVTKQLRERSRAALRREYTAAQQKFTAALEEYRTRKASLIDGEQRQRNQSQRDQVLNQELGLGITAKEYFARFDTTGKNVPLEDQLRDKQELLDILLQDQAALQ